MWDSDCIFRSIKHEKPIDLCYANVEKFISAIGLANRLWIISRRCKTDILVRRMRVHSTGMNSTNFAKCIYICQLIQTSKKRLDRKCMFLFFTSKTVVFCNFLRIYSYIRRHFCLICHRSKRIYFAKVIMLKLTHEKWEEDIVEWAKMQCTKWHDHKYLSGPASLFVRTVMISHKFYLKKHFLCITLNVVMIRQSSWCSYYDVTRIPMHVLAHTNRF